MLAVRPASDAGCGGPSCLRILFSFFAVGNKVGSVTTVLSCLLDVGG